jgi:ASC-1-like (ASCH) protein
MLKNEGVSKVLLEVKTIEDGEKIYHTFYSFENEKLFGVVAFRLNPSKIAIKNKPIQFFFFFL